MDDAWTILVAAGVPDGAIRPVAPPPDASTVRGALESLAPRLDDLPLRDQELLFAWLRAYAHHWPAAFDARFGSSGAEVLRGLDRDRFDPNRYLKLRRIAVENIARTARGMERT